MGAAESVRLARLETRAFFDQPQCAYQWPIGRRLGLWLTMFANVLVYERRVSPDGQGLCLLGRVRPAGAAWCGFGVAAYLAGCLSALAWMPWLVVAPMALGVFLCAPAFRVRHRSGPSRARLTQAQAGLDSGLPPRPWLSVHSVASLRPGAGREVIEALCQEADEAGWNLILDAGNETLARYYEAFGFVAIAEGASMPWGEAVVRMVRTADKEVVVGV